jgi:hypothetical protein
MGTTAEQLRDGKQGAPEVTGRSSARRMTGSVGLAVAVLFAAGNALWALDQPEAGASSHQIVSFYSGTSSRIIAGASVSLLAAALLVFFASGVRTLLREHAPDDLLPSAAFGGLLLVVAAGARCRDDQHGWRPSCRTRAAHPRTQPGAIRDLLCPRLQRRRSRNRRAPWRDRWSRMALTFAASPLDSASALAARGRVPHASLSFASRPAIVLLAIVSIRLLLTARAELSTVKPASRSADRA